jgi:spermidine synthase
VWTALHGGTPDRIVVAEDATGVSVLRVEHGYEDPANGGVALFINGLRQSWLPYGDIHTVLGALPAFFHPNPRTAAIIGLGSGDTVYAMAGRPEIERVTSIEILRPQLLTLRELARRYPYPPLQSVVTGSRVEHLVGDGRLYLTQHATRYDIIEADALRPTSAYSGTLYSDAYFELLRSRLNPKGLAVSWAPTERVARTFVRVFPHVWRGGQILVGSNDPIEVDRDAVLERFSDPRIDSYYRWANVDIARLMQPYLRGPFRRYGPDHDRAALVDINTDLHPKDEFELWLGY